MNPSLKRGLAAVTFACLTPLSAMADPISYTLTDHAARENGYRIAGVITTDGTLGNWTSNHIVSWNVTLYDSLSAIVYSIESGVGGATIQNFLADGIVATEESFGVISGIGGFTLAANPTGNANRVGYSPTTDQGRFFGNREGGWIIWNSVITPGTTFVIGTAPAAAVPEPATMALALAGLGMIGFARRLKKPTQAA